MRSLQKMKLKNRKSNRLKNYDYSQAGWYFVTICTKDHINHFGKIKNCEMVLNKLRKIVEEYWKKIETLYENIELDYYVIMPNHIHGIIIINYVGDANLASPKRNARFAFPTDRTKMELSKVVQQFKRAVTMKSKSENPNSNFKWQRSFYERIIRNEKELFQIRKYIRLNPDSPREIDNE